jgi:glycosyltransferase involved in cell wall biosynthesis
MAFDLNLEKKINIYLDPRAKISYASFYIEGISQLFRDSSISFNIKYFNDLIQIGDSEAFDHYFAFVIITLISKIKIVIDYRDKDSFSEIAYKWCDIYAKVNYNSSKTGVAYQKKTIAIGPGFGIKIFDFPISYYHAFHNLINSLHNSRIVIKHFLAHYYRQKDRKKLNAYIKSESVNNYVFFVSTLWTHKNCVESTNPLRASFIRTCKNNRLIDFEGGLVSNRANPEFNNYKDIILHKRINNKVYMQNIRRSAFVFNTPAVWNCHGWKLGEYFALGKAIISSPLSNDMPVPLIHGENIHFVENSYDIQEAVEMIIENKEYRLKLEKGAFDYWQKFLSPKSVIQRIVNSYQKST